LFFIPENRRKINETQKEDENERRQGMRERKRD